MDETEIKKLLDKWYGKKFKYLGRIYTCEGVEIQTGKLIAYDLIDNEYFSVEEKNVEEVKEPRVIYVNEHEDGFGTPHDTKESAESYAETLDNVKTIKFKEVIE